jgi:hypothetical protein
VIGGARTGSNLHVDPDFTAAWNALLAGTKRWALFPPAQSAEQRARMGVPPSGTPPLAWWLDHYPRICAELEDQRAQQPLGMLECEQRAGDIIFVPAGWWHCVLNTVPSGLAIAVTQNLLPPSSLPAIWDALSTENPRLAAALARQLAKPTSVRTRERVPSETLARMGAWLEAHDTESGLGKVGAGRRPCVLFFNWDGVLATTRAGEQPSAGASSGCRSLRSMAADEPAGAESKAEPGAEPGAEAGIEPGGATAAALTEACVGQLRRVARETGAELVVTAPWRASEEAKAHFCAILGARGLVFRRAVTSAQMEGGLPSQILDFTVQAAIDRWAVVDSAELFGGRELSELSMMQMLVHSRTVRTRPHVGLDESCANELIDLLNNDLESDEEDCATAGDADATSAGIVLE